MKDEPVKNNRERLLHRGTDQLPEFADRRKAKEASIARPGYSQNAPQTRPKGPNRQGSIRRSPNRRTYNQVRSPYASEYKRSPKMGAEEELGVSGKRS